MTTGPDVNASPSHRNSPFFSVLIGVSAGIEVRAPQKGTDAARAGNVASAAMITVRQRAEPVRNIRDLWFEVTRVTGDVIRALPQLGTHYYVKGTLNAHHSLTRFCQPPEAIPWDYRGVL